MCVYQRKTELKCYLLRITIKNVLHLVQFSSNVEGRHKVGQGQAYPWLYPLPAPPPNFISFTHLPYLWITSMMNLFFPDYNDEFCYIYLHDDFNKETIAIFGHRWIFKQWIIFSQDSPYTSFLMSEISILSINYAAIFPYPSPPPLIPTTTIINNNNKVKALISIDCGRLHKPIDDIHTNSSPFVSFFNHLKL